MSLRYIKNAGRNLRILEVGCGEGTGIKLIESMGFSNIFGVEVSEERLRRARLKVSPKTTLELITPDSKLPYANDSFDLVISCAVIEHAENPHFFLREINRVLKRGSVAIISSDCFTWRILQLLGMYNTDQPLDKTFSPLAFKRLFKSSGFRIEHTDTFNLPERGNLYLDKLRNSKVGPLCRKIKKIIKSNNKITPKKLTGPSKIESATSGKFSLALGTEIERGYYSRLKTLIGNFIDDENVFYLTKM
jgi:SAM-dependent methyltransferase